MPNTVTNRQLFFILFMTLTAIASVDISKVMVQGAGTSGWVTILITALLFGLAAFTWAKLNGMYEGKMIFEYSQHLIGKIGAYLLTVYFTQYFITVLVALNMAMASQLQTNFLPNTPMWATITASVIVTGFVAQKGVTNTARLVEIYGVIMLLVAATVHSIMIAQGNVDYILPLYNPAQTGRVFSAVREMVFPFLGIELIAIFPFTAKNGAKAASTVFFTVIGVGVFYVINALSCVMLIGENEILHYNFPLIAAIRQVELPILKFLQRIDLTYLTVGFIALLAGLSLIYLSIVEFICRMLPKVRRVVVVVSVGIAALLAYTFLHNVPDIQKTLRGVVTISGVLLAVPVPLVLILLTKGKNHGKKKA